MKTPKTTTTGKGICALHNYKTTGFRPVTAESMKDAAEIFAQRMALRDYGSLGRVGFVRFHRWNAFSDAEKRGEWLFLLESPTGKAWHHANLEICCHE